MNLAHAKQLLQSRHSSSWRPGAVWPRGGWSAAWWWPSAVATGTMPTTQRYLPSHLAAQQQEYVEPHRYGRNKEWQPENYSGGTEYYFLSWLPQKFSHYLNRLIKLMLTRATKLYQEWLERVTAISFQAVGGLLSFAETWKGNPSTSTH